MNLDTLEALARAASQSTHLMFISDDEWDEIADELTDASKRGASPDLDAMQCSVLLDLVGQRRVVTAVRLLQLIAAVRAAKAVAYSNGFDAALPDKQAALRAAVEELERT